MKFLQELYRKVVFVELFICKHNVKALIILSQTIQNIYLHIEAESMQL